MTHEHTEGDIVERLKEKSINLKMAYETVRRTYGPEDAELYSEELELNNAVIAEIQALRAKVAEGEALLKQQTDLVSRLCVSVDLSSQDIGGGEPQMPLLAQLGPICDKAETFLSPKPEEG